MALLTWENNCANSSPPCGFTLYPYNPQYLPSLAVSASSQAQTLQLAALEALKKSFSAYPVTVVVPFIGSPGTGDHRANVVDGSSFDGSAKLCGTTPPVTPSYDSSIYDQENMGQAQYAVPLQLITAQDVQNALNNAALIKAIGAGFGNNSAHEIAHQFLGLTPGMHDGSQNTYVGGDCDGSEAPCVYGRGAIQWGPNRNGVEKRARRYWCSGGLNGPNSAAASSYDR